MNDKVMVRIDGEVIAAWVAEHASGPVTLEDLILSVIGMDAFLKRRTVK